jgi:hypothetical protein
MATKRFAVWVELTNDTRSMLVDSIDRRLSAVVTIASASESVRHR